VVPGGGNMNDYEGPERRARCNDCVKDDVGTLVDAVANLKNNVTDLCAKVSRILGASGWQKTIIVLLLGGAIGGSLLSSYVVIAKANTDGTQNTEIAKINMRMDSIEENVETLTQLQIQQQRREEEQAKLDEQRAQRDEEKHEAFLKKLEEVSK
jgi:hypothetical protein